MVYSHKKSKEVIALYRSGYEMREDGQLEGRNGGFSINTIWIEDQDKIQANCVNPYGFVSRMYVELYKEEWESILKQRDILMGFHIPKGSEYKYDNTGRGSVLLLPNKWVRSNDL